MVEMYVWLLVTLAVAVGVLLLAGILSPGDHDDVGEDDDGAPVSAWSSLWQDFLSATANLRARLDRLRHRSGPSAGPGSPERVSVLPRSRPAARGRTSPASPPAAGRTTAGTTSAGQAAAAEATPAQTTATSNTSFEEFFEATATSGPAYLDAAQLSEALNSLRR